MINKPEIIEAIRRGVTQWQRAHWSTPKQREAFIADEIMELITPAAFRLGPYCKIHRAYYDLSRAACPRCMDESQG